jgi:glyoxylase-like metal-dependent hydrolase (beta-lactamase superfamily II)
MKPELCAPNVHRLLTMMVNVYFVSDEAGGWTLVDAGLPGYKKAIRAAAEALFGDTAPSAIVLTHGHFDHVGTLPALAREWGVPVYAHPLEMPYLTGRSSYAPPDPAVGGGLWPWLSPLFPRAPINLGSNVHMLPADGGVPTMPGWKWIHTPGHTAGHVSLFREQDRTLLAGDAFVTTRQESISNVLMQRELVWRPPAYYTVDWEAARRSVERLAALEPEVAATGHGNPLRGAEMRHDLHHLARCFDDVVPSRGRYVHKPAVADEHGLVYVPPSVGPSRAAIGIGVAALVGMGLFAARRSMGRI